MILGPTGGKAYVITVPFAPFAASQPPTHYPIETRLHVSWPLLLAIFKFKGSVGNGTCKLFSLVKFHETFCTHKTSSELKNLPIISL